jgi:ribosomal protein L29
MKAQEMRDLSLDDLRMRFQKASGQLTDTSNLRQARREVARLATIVREREREGDKA